MQAKLTIIVVAPSRVGGLDVIVPVLQRIKELYDEVKIIGFFLDDRVLVKMNRDKLLKIATDSVFTKKLVFRKSNIRFRNLRKVLLQPLILAKLTASIVGTSKPIMLHAGDVTKGGFKMLSVLVHANGGKVYKYPGSMVISSGKSPNKSVAPGTEGDGYLCFNTVEADLARSAGFGKIYKIGYPRLYDSWIDFIWKVSTDQRLMDLPRMSETAGQKQVILVLLSSTVPGVFETGELNIWFDEVIVTLRRAFPKAHILIKPHPMQDSEQLKQLSNSLEHGREIVTYSHTAALAALSDFAISCSSSVIIDVLAMSTPLVLHQRFTDHWRRRHPELSSYLLPGVPHSTDKKGLAAAIQEITAPNYQIPDIKGWLNHFEDFSFLFG
jgi:hypothetical protein